MLADLSTADRKQSLEDWELLCFFAYIWYTSSFICWAFKHKKFKVENVFSEKKNSSENFYTF